MDVTTNLSKFCLSEAFGVCLLVTDFTDLSSLPLLSQQANTKMRLSVNAVWMEYKSSLFHTAVRGAARIYRVMRPVLRPSSTVARSWKPTALRTMTRNSYWLEVRDEGGLGSQTYSMFRPKLNTTSAQTIHHIVK